MTTNEKPGKAQRSSLPKQAAAWALASNFAFGVMGMAAVGWAVQRWIWPASAPWLLLACIGLGLFGGGYSFIREAIRMNNS
jgi:F0F1-type ATP synthase assembly protein I